MKDTSKVVACVVDHGQFIDVARRLSHEFQEVYYYCPSERGCQVISEGIIGDGFNEFQKVRTIHEVKSKCDLFVFPDIGFYSEQAELREQGFAVWGSGDAGLLEERRGLFLETLKSLDMPVPNYTAIRGIENLRSFLKNAKDKYIKISRWRGNIETTHWRSWKQDSYVLDQWAVIFGPAQGYLTFYVFDPIPEDVEDGFDTWVVDGQMPSLVMHGQENKDKSYIGVMQEFSDLPDTLKELSYPFMRELGERNYRAPFSTEARGRYFIDPTLRCPSPPHQLQMELVKNFGEVAWLGANGILVEPEIEHNCGVQALVSCEREKDEWAIVEVPESIEPYFYPMYACKLDGAICFPPGGLGSMLAWITGTGNTIQEAIETLQERKSELPNGVCCDDKSLAELLKDVAESDSKPPVPIPPPEIVLDESN